MIQKNGPSRPKGMSSMAMKPAGMTTSEISGMAARLASSPWVERRWKWVMAKIAVASPPIRDVARVPPTSFPPPAAMRRRLDRIGGRKARGLERQPA